MNRMRNSGRGRGPSKRPRSGNQHRGRPSSTHRTGGNRQGSRPHNWKSQNQEQGAGASQLRITGGESRGRLVRCPVGFGVRPTSEKLREAVFDLLGKLVEDAVFYDGFAGTGAMGIEALSRGAKWALFIENGRRVELVLKNNVAGLGYANKSEILNADFMEFCRGKKNSRIDPPDIIYLDPPYNVEDHLELLFAIADAGWQKTNPDLLVILERPARRLEIETEDCPESLNLKDLRRYGDSSLYLFTAR